MTRKVDDKSFAVGFCSILTILSTTIAGNRGQKYPPNGAQDAGHSLILPQDHLRFTESLIIVGTLDGKLRGLERNGAVRWSTALSEEPLLSSSLSSVQMMDEFTGFCLIPSLDGGLYQFSWDSIEAIPLNADTLLSSSFKLNEGIGLVGGKNVMARGIDPGTGKVIYSCSDDGCNDNGSSPASHDILVIKRIQKIVRAVSERTGVERWNFSVGQHRLSFLNGVPKGSQDRIPDANSSAKQNIHVSIPEGIIAGVQKQNNEKAGVSPGNVAWQQQFDTPIAAVWLLQDGMLEKLDLLEITVPPKLNANDNIPLMYYIGSHEDQLYIHPSDKIENAVECAIQKAMSRSSNNHALLSQSKQRTIWKPYLATSASRTPAIVGKTELAVRQPLDYPFDNGHYFYGQFPDPSVACLNNNTDAGGANVDAPQGIFIWLKRSILKWWRELLILIFTFGFFVRQVFKYWYRRAGLREKGLTLSLSLGDCEIQVSRKSEEIRSSQSSLPTPVASQENFVSRYECDFEHETCLGKGAFGLVFQARNKLDACQYAVKRIRLPNDDKSRTKVMREVRVLASLDHPGIVRYYNSWCEETPVEWLRDWDDKLKGDSKCPTLTSLPSLTEKSDEDKEMLQISVPDDSSHEEEEDSLLQRFRSKSSRKRHDTLTVENEKSLSEVEGTASSASSFSVESRSNSVNRNTSNSNSRKDDDSSFVVFCRSNNSNTDDEDSCSNSSNKHSSGDALPSTSKGGSSLHLLYIQMQLCCRDSLKDWLNGNVEERNFSLSIDIFRQLVVAVEYIHQEGHIHRDLKPSNILFAPDGATIKVGDFGLVAACKPFMKEDSDHDESAEASHHNLTGQVGTQLYMSPEQVTNTKYCQKVDIFSLGIIFFELFHVFKTEMERRNVLTALRKRAIPEKFRQDMPLQSEFALWLLADEPKDRPSAQEISSSVLFTQLLNILSTSSTSS